MACYHDDVKMTPYLSITLREQVHYGATDRGESTGSEDDLGGSVLQAKLEQLAVQIGYAGMLMASLTVIVLVLRFAISTYSQRYKYSHLPYGTLAS